MDHVVALRKLTRRSHLRHVPGMIQAVRLTARGAPAAVVPIPIDCPVARIVVGEATTRHARQSTAPEKVWRHAAALRATVGPRWQYSVL